MPEYSVSGESMASTPALAQAWATQERRPARSQKKRRVACCARSLSATLDASMMTHCGSGAFVPAAQHGAPTSEVLRLATATLRAGHQTR